MNRNRDGSPRLFVYVVVHDTGFAPNPFFGYCTLATCKPRIRDSAQVGDWIAGIGSVRNGQDGKLLFAMRVAEAMCFDEYWNDVRFARKRPDRSGGPERRCGDNIYHRDPETGKWIQAESFHSRTDGSPDGKHVLRDTDPPRVLVARVFAYFGATAVDIPGSFRSWDGRDYFGSVRGHRCNFPVDLQNDFIAWLQRWSTEAGGLAGEPLDWATSRPTARDRLGLGFPPKNQPGNSTRRRKVAQRKSLRSSSPSPGC